MRKVWLVIALLGCQGKGVIEYVSQGAEQETKVEKNLRAFLSPSSLKLKRAQNCDEVREYIELLMERYAEEMIKGRWAEEERIDEGITIEFTLEGGEPEHSETTVQERGIDEADVVKTDGMRIYTTVGGKLIVVRSYPTKNAELLASVPVEGAYELLVEGEKIFAFSQNYQCSIYYRYLYPYCPQAFSILEFEGLNKPELVKNILVDGMYITARKKGSRIFVVGDKSNWGFFSKYNPIFLAILNEARKHNFEVEDVEIEVGFEDVKEILPKIVELSLYVESTTMFVKRYEYPIDCSNVFISSDASGLDTAFVILLEPGKEPEVVYTIGVGSETAYPFVYMSQRSIYIAYSKDGWFWGEDDEEKTIIHRFDISDGVRYSATGEVDGRISVVWGRTGYKNAELSMNEYEGFLRVATSKGYFGDSDNIVSVLEEKDGKLEVIGQVSGIAPGELIHSVRFLEDKGFIVTFKKTDPFFTLDLRDPRNPEVLGELKVSGYSSLILPFGDSHVLTVGKETEDVEDFAWFQGVQLSIFDVSDMSSPKLAHRIEIGSRGTESEALYDYRALTLFKNILALPISLYEGGAGGWESGEFKFSGFSAYRVSVEDGFEHIGYIKGCECEGYCSYRAICNPLRSVIIEDTIWALTTSFNKISFLASDIESLNPITTVEVPIQTRF